MTGFLLDTNAISFLSPTRPAMSPAFSKWLKEQEEREAVYLSSMTVHEIEKGAHLLKNRGATSKAATIEIFLQGLLAGYGDKILPFDAQTAQMSGRMEAKAVAAGHSPGVADAVIAGTAFVHGLIVLTLNVKHFLPFSIAVKSPDELG